tara:strand:+ start:6351 stop:6452 length:102 start_codon:yes stop_codon:yes gene_type:complete
MTMEEIVALFEHKHMGLEGAIDYVLKQRKTEVT